MFYRTKYLVVLIAVILLCVVSSAAYSTIGLAKNFNNPASVIATGLVDNEIDFVVEKKTPVDINQEKKERLAQLSKKISELNISEVVDEEDVSEVENEQVEDVKVESVQLCSNYKTYDQTWIGSGLKFEVVEGARLLKREVNGVVDIVLQLPIYTSAFGGGKCLATDVVGIAVDGSLINNSDYSIYSIFGSETLIGYALDGFPIYGLNSSTKVDTCGGSQISGEYKYYLDSEREGVIGCFSGSPVTL